MYLQLTHSHYVLELFSSLSMEGKAKKSEMPACLLVGGGLFQFLGGGCLPHQMGPITLGPQYRAHSMGPSHRAHLTCPTTWAHPTGLTGKHGTIGGRGNEGNVCRIVTYILLDAQCTKNHARMGFSYPGYRTAFLLQPNPYCLGREAATFHSDPTFPHCPDRSRVGQNACIVTMAMTQASCSCH